MDSTHAASPTPDASSHTLPPIVRQLGTGIPQRAEDARHDSNQVTVELSLLLLRAKSYPWTAPK
jgi:hypothetical protein